MIGLCGFDGLASWNLCTSCAILDSPAIVVFLAASELAPTINGFAQIGGFAGPYLVGWIRDATQSFTPALLALAAGPIIAGILCLGVSGRTPART